MFEKITKPPDPHNTGTYSGNQHNENKELDFLNSFRASGTHETVIVLTRKSKQIL